MIERYRPGDLGYQLACGSHSGKESERTVPGQMSALSSVVDPSAFWEVTSWDVYHDDLMFHLEMSRSSGSLLVDEALLQEFAVSGPDF